MEGRGEREGDFFFIAKRQLYQCVAYFLMCVASALWEPPHQHVSEQQNNLM